VLEFATSLAANPKRPRGRSPESFKTWAGLIPADDHEQMRAGIEQGCGNIDLEAWNRDYFP